MHRLAERTACVHTWAVLTWLTLAAAPALAETPAVEAPVSLARLPAPVDVPAAAYPPDALAAGQEAAVLLQVGVDATGAVLGVAVVESAGDAFDRGAVQALRAARFTPALDDAGQPVAATILYRVRFTVARAPAVSVEGTARLPDGSAVVGVELRAVGEGGATRLATTDGDGHFRFVGLPAGPWTVVFEAPGLQTATLPVQVVDGQVGVVEVQAAFAEEVPRAGRGEVVVIEATRIRTEVTERKLDATEIAFLPGTNGDVVKVVQNLPGVARPPLGTGNLIIRGAAPEDSAAFLDGARIPVVFHFAGLTTVINGDLLSEVAFVPGNASVRYGRFLSGMVELRSDAEVPAEPNGTLSVDLYQTSLYVEHPVGEQGGLTFSLRRSYADAVLDPVLDALPGLDARAPRYFDLQARAQGVVDRTKWDVLMIASDDRFALLGEEGAEDDAAVDIGLSTTFWRLRGSGVTDLGDGLTHELRLSGGTDRQAFNFDVSGRAYEDNATVALRDELSRDVESGRTVGFRLGVDVEAGPQGFLYDVPDFGPREEGSALRIAPAAYAEGTFRFGGFRVVPGLRVDGLLLDDDYARAAVDPRLSLRWAVTDTTVLRAGVGRYSQFPTVRQLLPDGDGNPDLGPAWSLQSSVGVEQSILGIVTVDAQVFYNHLDDLVVGREDRIRFFTGPPSPGPFDEDPYANDGEGRVCGGELLVRVDYRKFLGLVSLTVSNSVRVKRPGDATTLFEYDQPVVLNVLASQELPKGWRVGGRVRYGSGNPYTPVVNRVYDLESRGFVPVYGENGSDRLPDFFSLDLRVDKTWSTRWGSIGAYVDVQNATYAQNVEVMGWTYDYGEIDPVAGLPPLPTFGVAAKW